VILAALIIVGWAQFGLARVTKERLARAKSEGTVNFYSIWNVPNTKGVVDLFMKKYPFLRVNSYRAGGGASGLLNKILIEARAGKNDVDVILMTDLYWKALADEGLVTPYCSPGRRAFANRFKDDKCLWTMMNINTHVIAYNTEAVSQKEAPKNLYDLLDPKWRGKLVMDQREERWFTYTLDKMGEEKGMEFMRKLAAQKPEFRRGHTLMLQLLAAGEYPVNVMAYGHGVELMKSKGAPLNWVADQPVTTTGSVVSLAKHAPHPEAAKLLIDFIMSYEGQKVHLQFKRIPTRNDVPPDPPRLLEGLEIYPVKMELADRLNERTKEFHKIFGIN
jgi:ABC-type Fe3+ transport system substrate-binding protein